MLLFLDISKVVDTGAILIILLTLVLGHLCILELGFLFGGLGYRCVFRFDLVPNLGHRQGCSANLRMFHPELMIRYLRRKNHFHLAALISISAMIAAAVYLE